MRLNRNPQFVLGACLVAAFAAMAAFAPHLAPRSPTQQNLLRALLPPAWMEGGSWEHLLGTDQLGRDLLSRIIFGARVSIAVGVFAVLLAGSIGTAVGMVAGYYGGRVDRLVSRLIDIQLSLPPVFLAIAIMAAVGQTLFNLIAVLGAVTWVSYARVARAQTLQVRGREFVESAHAMGASDAAIMLRHVLPNIASPLAVIATVNMSAMILAEAALSFLGLGVQPPTPAWGSMVAQAREVLSIAWWNTLFPGAAIVLLVTGANLMGEGLRARQ